MKNVIKVICLFILSVSAYSANAATINGSFGVTGGLSTDAGSGTLADVTQITLLAVIGNSSTWTGVTDVTGLANFTAGAPADLTSAASVPGFLVLGDWSLELTKITYKEQDSSKLLLEGVGVLTGADGYDPTAASWSFSTSTLGFYSMSVSAVPVPAAVWLFGSGLIGLVGIARRKAEVV